jgi:hypothetical protein
MEHAFYVQHPFFSKACVVFFYMIKQKLVNMPEWLQYGCISQPVLISNSSNTFL